MYSDWVKLGVWPSGIGRLHQLAVLTAAFQVTESSKMRS